MGLELEEYEIGDFCANCDGNLWPAGLTPKFAFALVTGITACPPVGLAPPNGYWKLTQMPGTPCSWRLTVGNFTFLLSYGVGTSFGIFTPGPPAWFRSNGGACLTSLDNLNNCIDVDTFGTGGSVTWYMGWDPYAVLLAETYNMTPQETILYDKFFTPDFTRVYRFARNIDKTNVKIKFEPP